MQGQTITPSVAPVQWRFPPRWRILPGVAHGIRQPVMLGEWHCKSRAPHDFTRLDKAMAQWIPEPLPEGIALLHDTASLLRRMLFWVGAAQRQLKVPVFASAKVVPVTLDSDGGLWSVAMPYVAPQANLAALSWVSQQVHLVLHAAGTAQARAAAQDMAPLAGALQAYALRDFNTIRFLAAAHALDIPTRPVVPGVHAFGQGRHCRWLESSYTDRTPVVGSRIARDKVRTAQVLRQLGLPAPIHERAPSQEAAVQIARMLGYPVVVKPADRDQGIGVSADLRDDAAVQQAFAHASGFSKDILVEKHVHGQDYRLTVLDGRLIKTVLRRPAGILGDGQQTIAALVAQLRDDPAHARAGTARGHGLLELDAEAHGLLAQEGMSAATIPAQGVFVVLRRRANVSAGGTPVLVNGTVHPDNQRLAERCARALGLDLAGIDLIIGDIGQSWLQTGALVCEVNAQPQLGAGLTPGIYADVLRQLLPGPSRIPVALIVGAGQSVAAELLAQHSRHAAPWGLADTHGLWQGRERIAAVQGSAFDAARMLEANRDMAAAVVVTTPAQITLTGLAFDHIDVLVLAGPGADGHWQDAQMQQMWAMVLPHIGHIVVLGPRAQAWLPAPERLAETSAHCQLADDSGPAMLATIAGLMRAAA